MRSKKYSTAIICILFFISCISIYAVSSGYDLHVDHCTLAAEAFDVSVSSSDNTPGSESAGTLLPQLIMGHMSRAMKRGVTDEERMQDKMWPLRQERLELFMALDNAIRSRDAVVLLPISNGARRRRLKAAQKTIKEAKKALEDNLTKTNITIEKGQKALRPPLDIKIYNDDNNTLWDSGVKEAYDTNNKHESVKYSQAAVRDGIDTLITGKVTLRDGYLSASVAVYVYPLAKKVGEVSDVGSSAGIVSLAMRLAQEIIPIVTNTMSSHVIFDISPLGATAKLSLSIDDSVYQGNSPLVMTDGISVSAGLHTLSFVSEGYYPASATYSFIGGKTHLVQVEMREVQDEELFVQFTGLNAPSFDKIDYSSNSISVTANAEEQRLLGNGAQYTASACKSIQSAIKIDGKSILGVVLTRDAPPAEFYVPLSLIKDNATLEVKTKVFDRAKYIDKRRRWFYFSYSMLITSLIGAFYTTGRYNAMNGYEAPDTLQKWKNARNATAIVSGTCGIWAIYELVRYLRAASKVLPAEAQEADYFPELDDAALDHSNSSEESIQVPQSLDNP